MYTYTLEKNKNSAFILSEQSKRPHVQYVVLSQGGGGGNVKLLISYCKQQKILSLMSSYASLT